MSSLIQPYRFVSATPIMPVYLSRSNNAINSANTSHAFTMPGTINAGDLLIALGCFSGASVTFGGGFAEIADAGAVANNIGVGYKIAAGGDTLTVTSSASIRSALSVIRIQAGTFDPSVAPAVGSYTTGTNVNPDPSALNPGWGTYPILWLAVAATQYNASTPGNTSAYPTNYSTGQGNSPTASATPSWRLASGMRALTSDTQNPGTFTQAAPNITSWRALTLAIKGA